MKLSLYPTRNLAKISGVDSGNLVGVASPSALTSVFNVENYGAVHNGSTDDVTAVTAAYTALQAAGGGTLYFPAGVYAMASFPSITANYPVRIVGAGQDRGNGFGTVLSHSALSGDFITFSGAGHSSIENLSIRPLGRKTSGYELVFNNCYNCGADHVRFDYAYSCINFSGAGSADWLEHIVAFYCLGDRGIKYAGTVGNTAAGLDVFNFIGNNPYPNTVGTRKTWATTTAFTANDIILVNGKIYQCTTSGTSSGAGSGPSGLPSGTTPATAFSNTITDGTVQWKFVAHFDLTWIECGNYSGSLALVEFRAINGANGIKITDAAVSGSSHPQFFFWTDIECDHSYSNGILLEGGRSIQCDQLWIGSCLVGNGITVNSAFKGDMHLDNSFIGECRLAGVSFVGSGPVDNSITGSFIQGNSNGLSGSNPGISIPANFSKLTISDCKIGSGSASSADQGYGIFINAGTSDYLDIHDNNVSGNVTLGIALGAITGTHNSIRNNAGYNPVGAASVTTSASPYTYTAGVSPETLYVSASTSITAMTIGGTSILPAATGANVNFTIELGPNEAVVITYTGSLTAKKMVH